MKGNKTRNYGIYGGKEIFIKDDLNISLLEEPLEERRTNKALADSKSINSLFVKVKMN